MATSTSRSPPCEPIIAVTQHSRYRQVTLRLVMPLAGGLDLQNGLAGIISNLQQQGVIQPIMPGPSGTSTRTRCGAMAAQQATIRGSQLSVVARPRNQRADRCLFLTCKSTIRTIPRTRAEFTLSSRPAADQSQSRPSRLSNGNLASRGSALRLVNSVKMAVLSSMTGARDYLRRSCTARGLPAAILASARTR